MRWTQHFLLASWLCGCGGQPTPLEDCTSTTRVCRCDGGEGIQACTEGTWDECTCLTDAGPSDEVDAGSDVGPPDPIEDSGVDALVDVDASEPDPCDPAAGRTWQTLPSWSALGEATPAYSPSVAFVGGAPMMVFLEEPSELTPPSIYTARFVGGEWISIGSALRASPGGIGTPSSPRLLAAGDRTFLAWQETASEWDEVVHVAELRGETWVSLGGPLVAHSGLTRTTGHDLLWTEDGLVVAWLEATERDDMEPVDRQVYVRRWDGVTWTPMGTPRNRFESSPGYRGPRLATDSAGRVLLAWGERTNEGGAVIVVERWRDEAWEAVGTPIRRTIAPASLMQLGSMAAGGGRVVVGAYGALTDDAPRIEVFSLVGEDWESLGSPDEGLVGVRFSGPSLPLGFDAAGRPVIAFDGSGPSFGVFLRVFDGSEWSTLGGPFGSGADARTSAGSSSLALDGCGGPILSWPRGSSFQSRSIETVRLVRDDAVP